MSEIVHIEHSTGSQIPRCGSATFHFVNWIKDGSWSMDLEPTCEACILLHWIDPSKTFYL